MLIPARVCVSQILGPSRLGIRLEYTTTPLRLFTTTTCSYASTKNSHSFPKSWSFRESTVQWIKSFNFSQLKNSQDQLLSRALPYYNKRVNGLLAKTSLVPVDSNGNYLNELCIENESAEDGKTQNLVILHGYASSLGWFYKNFDDLIRDNTNTKVHCLDMLGFGLSSKPKLNFDDETNGVPLEIEFDREKLDHHKHVHKALHLPESYTIDASNWTRYVKGQKKLVTSVESTYVDSIENWRSERGIESFDLLGHSLGGYMSIAYALKYPNRVNRLILASPGGVERSPYAISNPKMKQLIENVGESGKIKLKPSNSPGEYGFLGRLPTLKRRFVKFWQNQHSFFTLLRLSGPYGPRAISAYTFKRFTRSGNISSLDELSLFTSYIYNSFTTPSFSETSIMKIFAPPVMAKWPMLDRIDQLQCKTLWLYGQYDWMFNITGQICVDQLNGRKGVEKGSEAVFCVIPNAGHNVYFDNWRGFNGEVKKFLGWR